MLPLPRPNTRRPVVHNRVAIFLPALSGGGAERAMLNLAAAFSIRGKAVDLVLSRREGPYLDEIPPQVRLVDLGVRRMIKALPALMGYLRRERPEVLLSAITHANVIALAAAKTSAVPVRITVTEQNKLSLSTARARNKRSRVLPHLARISYRWADGIVAVSRGVAEDLVKTLGLPAHRIKTIYNPVYSDELLQKAQEPPNHPWLVPGQPPVFLGMGRLTAQKDFETLLRAFQEVRQQVPSRLIILGEGEDRPKLERLICRLGLLNDVSLPGFVTNPFPYLSRAAVFVLSSRWEGFGNVLVEAMAVGTPVVSTDCPSGPSEILDGGRYGPLVPVGDFKTLADAMLHSLNHPVDSETLRRRAAQFHVQRIADQYLQVLWPQQQADHPPAAGEAGGTP